VIFREGEAAIPALMQVMEEGPEECREPASAVLTELSGLPAHYDAGAAEEKRSETLSKWREWWAANSSRYELSGPARVGRIFRSQLFLFLGKAVIFDFGRSFKNQQKISTMISDGIVPSLTLSVPAFILGIFVAVYISLLCAFYRNTWLDRGIVVLSVLGMSLSMLIYIIACQYVFAYSWNWFPVWGYEKGLASFSYVLLPILIWILVALGSHVRFFRTVILDEVNQDYVRTAMAKGISQNKVLFKHVLKNAMIPIITRLVIAIPFLYTGSLLLERFFGIPGLGNMLVEAVNNSDLFVVRAMTFIGAILYVAGNLVTDICYALVDPRIRLG
jgi:peptide/nickel transport system permease protein